MGATAGIGRGVAAALARESVRVAVASRSRERIEAAAAEIEGAHSFVADTRGGDRLAQLPTEIAETIEAPVSILVLNTGGPPTGPASAATPEVVVTTTPAGRRFWDLAPLR